MKVPAYAMRDAELPRNAIFAKLRDIWKLGNPGKRFSDLAEAMDATPQQISQWSTGSDNRVPPDWAISRLCFLTGRSIVWKPDCIQVVETSLSFHEARVGRQVADA